MRVVLRLGEESEGNESEDKADCEVAMLIGFSGHVIEGP